MPLQQTLDAVQQDISNGDLGKARDRLHGLINGYPDQLELRKQLGEIYWQLQMPEMAGRYWYLEEQKKDERMIEACHRFENQFGQDPLHILFAIRFKGQVEKIKDTYAGLTILRIQQEAREKHSWYGDYQKRGIEKFYSRESRKVRNKKTDGIFKWILIVAVLLLGFFCIVGVVSVIRWFL